jgi:beta-lactamase superfamily II metal-dependent hydrolase
MEDYIEVDFLGVETDRSGDAITVRYSVNGVVGVHVVDGGYVETGDQIIEHLKKFYGTTKVDHVVLTHPDMDHANGLRKVLEECEVRSLWMNRPWKHAGELIDRFTTYNSVAALERKLRTVYASAAMLEEIAQAQGIPISDAFQGTCIGPFTVLAPTKTRYLDLIVDSEKTPESEATGIVAAALESASRAFKTVANLVKAAWGHEYFPVDGTSSENEMSVVQYAQVNGSRVLLTGDTGREGLAEAADYAPMVGLTLPGIWTFQVPHHGGRHNVNTEVLDRWLGPVLPSLPTVTNWNAVCSSAKADIHHPKNSVKRAMFHRGAHWSETEGKTVRVGSGIKREGWSPLPQGTYPEDQED